MKLAAAVAGAVLCVCALGMRRARLVPAPDSDQFYHFAISRMTLEQGLLRQVPQVVGLGWDKRFPEKEFFYHVVTTAAFALSGESGIRALATLFLALSILAIAASARAPPLVLPLVVGFAALLTDTRFLGRMFLVRPHTLAALFLTLLLASLVRRWRLAAFLSAAGFALSYHAFYLPLAVLAGAAAIASIKPIPEREGLARIAVFGALGVLAGTVLNPYFPANVEMSMAHLGFARSPGAEVGAGLEFESLPFLLQLAKSPAVFGAFAAVAVIFAWRRRLAVDGTLGASPWVAAFSAALLFVVCLLSPRGFEYFPQAAIVAFLVAVGRVRPPARRAALGFVAVLSLWQAVGLVRDYGPGSPVRTSVGRQSAVDATLALPAGAPAMVFNCSYAIGPYLLDLRPNLRFVDILDPRLLLMQSADLFDLRNQLVAGRVGKPWEALREVFKADYVACYHRGLIAQLESDRRFARVYPLTAPTEAGLGAKLVRVYRLVDASGRP